MCSYCTCSFLISIVSLILLINFLFNYLFIYFIIFNILTHLFYLLSASQMRVNLFCCMFKLCNDNKAFNSIQFNIQGLIQQGTGGGENGKWAKFRHRKHFYVCQHIRSSCEMSACRCKAHHILSLICHQRSPEMCYILSENHWQERNVTCSKQKQHCVL